MQVGDEFFFVETGGSQLRGRGQTPILHEGVLDEFLEFLHLILMLFPAPRFGPESVIRISGPKRVVRVEDVQEDVKRDVAVVFEPGNQTIHVIPRCLALGPVRERALLVQLFITLVQVRELPGE